MSLYIEIHDDKPNYPDDVVSMFYCRRKQWWLSLKNRKTSLFPHENDELSNYQRILEYAKAHHIVDYKIEVDSYYLSSRVDDSLLHLFYEYALTEDVTIGIILPYHYASVRLDYYDALGIPVSMRRDINEVEGVPLGLLEGAPILKKRSLSLGMPIAGSIPLDIHLEESFHDKLLRYLNASGKSNAEIYYKCGISRQVFSKIISGAKPEKNTAICLALGLELTLDETNDILQSLGYALSKSLPFDVIITKHISKGIYDMDKINAVLSIHGCPLLGWRPRE